VQLIRGQDSALVEAYLVELSQKHINDYVSEWKNQLILYGQEDKSKTLKLQATGALLV
jgi:hypothetical protein